MKAGEIKKICCIGAGYVGTPTMSIFAYYCPHVDIVVVDINKSRIEAWNSTEPIDFPIFEPGLENIILSCRNKNLFFTTDIEKSISEADMVFISVNTPTKKRGIGAGKASDLKWVEASARQIAEYAKDYTIVVEKSTLPVRTAETIEKILFDSQKKENNKKNKTFSVLSNPEFLAEGSAVDDLQNPDRVLIGGNDEFAIEALSNLYKNWVPNEKIIRTNIWSSELSKLTANAFLAQRISSINSISAICEATGADINQVANAVGLDSRIGQEFLKAGPGFGGSCFQKDILNLIYLCNFYKLYDVANYWEGVIEINNWQKSRIPRIIVNNLFGNISGKKIGILGFAFKANTNDTRESPSINICKDLLEEGANLSIYDPKVEHSKIEEDLGIRKKDLNNNDYYGNYQICKSILDVALGSDALVILTEWEEFSDILWEELILKMRKPAWIFDTRICIDFNRAKEAGFNIWQIGKIQNKNDI